MWLTRISINNPVFASMMMLMLMVLGFFSYNKLPVEQFPDIQFPIAIISTQYPGATPEAVANEVSRKIEEAMNTISGVKSISSNSYEGLSVVIVQFELSVNVNAAFLDVRDKLSNAKTQFRPEIKEPSIGRWGPDDAPVLSIALSSPQHSLRELTTRADQYIIKRLQTVSGVGQVKMVGGVKRQIKIELDPEKLTALSLNVDTIMGVLQRETQRLPAGNLVKADREILVQVQGLIKNPAEFGELIIAQRGGVQIRLREVANIVDGREVAGSYAFVDGKPALAIDLYKVRGSNTVGVVNQLQQTIKAVQAELPPGMTMQIVFDGSRSIRNSLADVSKTLVEGAFLTIAVVFLFLGSWRSTVITGITLPIALMGTIFLLQMLGFSINVMTLMALSLCVGLLIDDSIVVRENITRHLAMGKSPYQAALDGTKEIGLAVLATTLTIVAVFLPVGFMDGIIGRFFFQFGLTVAGAVLISMFVSFTLDPMLSSLWHDPHAHGARVKGPLGWLVALFERIMNRTADLYASVVSRALQHRWKVVLTALLFFVSSFFVAGMLGKEFVPEADLSQLKVEGKTAIGSSLEYTSAKAQQVAAALSEIPEVKETYATVNAGIFVQGKNQFTVKAILVPRKDRKLGQKALVPKLRTRLQAIAGIKIGSIGAAESPSGGLKPIYLHLLGQDAGALKKMTQDFVLRMKKIPGLVDIETSIDEEKPALGLYINRSLANDLGLSVAQIGSALRPMLAGSTATTWLAPDDQNYDVVLQLPADARETQADLEKLTLSSSKLDAQGVPMQIPLSQVATIVMENGPTKINRFKLNREVQITANVQGRAAGDIGADLDKEIKAFKLPEGYRFEVDGANKDMAESAKFAMLALAMAVIFIYMILASQFNHFFHPIAIMASLPLSLIGVFLGLFAMGSTLSIFSIIGIIMLMGLVTKNAILLVDFVEQATHRGMERTAAIIEAGRVRLRPILMTTFAMVFGMLPLALGLGEGAEQRAPMAHALIGGVITSTILTLVVVPVVYTFMDDFGNRLRRFFARQSAFAKADVPHSEA